MGEVCPPTAADYAQLAAQGARQVADENSSELQALRLEVQELRQFCTMLLYNIPAPGPFSQTGLQLGQATKDHWWEKLASYPRVD